MILRLISHNVEIWQMYILFVSNICKVRLVAISVHSCPVGGNNAPNKYNEEDDGQNSKTFDSSATSNKWIMICDGNCY